MCFFVVSRRNFFVAVCFLSIYFVLGSFTLDLYRQASEMSIQELVGQMFTVDIAKFIDVNGSLLQHELAHWMNEFKPGSVFNSPFAFGKLGGRSGWNVTVWKDFSSKVAEISLLHGSNLPLLYGVDSLHGGNYILGAALFPHQIGQAASFNATLVKRIGEITARDTVAAGISWIYAPVLGIATQPLWPRVYETFGEDPYLVSILGTAMIQGIQSQGAAACMKHFIGYSNPASGRDRSPSWIPYRHLLQYYLPPFAAAIQAGVKTAMASFNDLNGLPVTSSSEYLSDLLRGVLGFNGVLVSDYNEIQNLVNWHQVGI